jgi:hypothetical protein
MNRMRPGALPRRPGRPGRLFALVLIALVAGASSSCATLQQVAALRRVDFHLDRVSGATLAGVRLEGKDSYSDLGTTDIARLVAAVALKNVPLSMTVHVEGENPPENSVTARLVQMDWTLFIDDVETVSGRLDREYQFLPGQPTDVPVLVELDLWDFFSGRAEDLFSLALGATGARGGTMNIALRARPTIQTPIGPIRYPSPITIVQRDVGSP